MKVNEIHGYSKGAADGKFKYLQRRLKIDRTTKDIVALIPQKSFSI